MINKTQSNQVTLTPKVTNPGPLAFGRNPSTLSFSVGSDLRRPVKMSLSI